ncbi:prostaglandin-H2 D-isomerase / glutathione transferase [Mytilus galloprovincialis]|uniref:Prostaglandin-H2 D-isomerase / glutathione transferase n=1 Tax=Mytilus galloprovincialis TaxID=29158 RepID=A0A8B6FIX2_MYTGA|nr:prostaglandin-H2 D-isomerase / glutathione transferase [Mytilus galloprovincialis]
MSAYKISYFNLMGRAELARIMLSAADKEFEDDRFEKEEWPERKPNTPCGQVPVLTHGDKQIPQSMAIARYLARDLDLYGKNNVENTKCDVVIECINDVITETVKLFFEQDETKKPDIEKNLMEVVYPRFLSHLEKMLNENSGEWLVGDKLSVADLAFFDLMNRLTAKKGDSVFETSPTMKKHLDKITNIAGVQKWLEKRPVTDM